MSGRKISGNCFDMSKLTLKHPFIDCYDEPTDLPKTKDEDVKQLRSWLRTQPHLPDLTDDHLLLFLHSNYFNIEAAQNTITAYFEIRRTTPELFKNRRVDDPNLQSAWRMSYQAAVPKRTPEGYYVCVIKFSDLDVNKFDFANCNKALFTFMDYRISENGLSPGYILVFDNAGFSFSHLMKLKIGVIRKMMRYIQDGNPIRLKGMHIINSGSFIDKILAVFRPFMKSTLLNLLHIHGSDLTEFFKYVPQEILPKDYGGTSPSLEILRKEYLTVLRTKYSKWLEENESLVMDSWTPPEPQPSYFSSWFKY